MGDTDNGNTGMDCDADINATKSTSRDKNPTIHMPGQMKDNSNKHTLSPEAEDLSNKAFKPNSSNRDKNTPQVPVQNIEPSKETNPMVQSQQELPIKNKLYTKYSKAPYFFYLQGKEVDIGYKNSIKVGKLIDKLNIKCVDLVRPIGKNRLEITTKTYKDANNLVLTNPFSVIKCEAYIPSFKVQKQGLIRGVDMSISEAEILVESRTSSGCAVQNARRIQYPSKENPTKKEPSGKVILTFEGNDLPEYIYLYHVRFQIEPYISRVPQCHKCLLFNHIQSQCRGTQVCHKCGDTEHLTTDCTVPNENLRCRNCKGEHSSTALECPERKKHMLIKTHATVHNVSYREASDMLKKPSYSTALSTSNKYDPLIYEQSYTDQLTNQSNKPQRYNRIITSTPKRNPHYEGPGSPILKTRIRTNPLNNPQYQSPPREQLFTEEYNNSITDKGKTYDINYSKDPNENIDLSSIHPIFDNLSPEIFKEIQTKLREFITQLIDELVNKMFSNKTSILKDKSLCTVS